ncbi:MAG TPA: ParB/RepB/Spo0J family partition protein [Gemmatimonadales bacterium]|nr:ParB/RepB/Spo0J family partition protein [Gemmatimonadales bacterium]
MNAKTGKRGPRKKKAPEARGLTATELLGGHAPAEVIELAMQIEGQGGSVLATYRDPLGGHWQLLAGLPIELVAPTPYQRDLSETHLKRLANAIDQLGRFLDPVITVRASDGTYWTPNGNHRLAALKALGARSIVALVVPDSTVAHRILVLNTEKAHNVRERALEVIRLAKGLAELDPRPEKEFLVEFEEPALLTLGLCYQENGRFAGGVYHPVLKRIDAFLDDKLPRALERRRKRAERLLKLDEVVGEAVAALKEKGFESPYLKAFVVARINPLRFKRGARAEFDATIEGMTAAARKFDVDKIKASQVARAGGAPEE